MHGHSRWLRWVPGRQRTGYEKLPLFELPFCDLYLLRYVPGTHVPKHQDPVQGRRHYRANLEIRRAREGGKFHCDGPLFKMGRLSIFRSDATPHWVTRVESGTRYVLSFGLALPTSR